ncbi:MAG: PEP-CTERM sorting domain-containing protein [Bryobacteraceae bacterium]
MNHRSLSKSLLFTVLVSAIPAHASIILAATAAVDQTGLGRAVIYNFPNISPFGSAFGGTGFRLQDIGSGPCTDPGCVSKSLTNGGLTDTLGTATNGFLSSHAGITLNRYLAGTDPRTGIIVNASADAFAAASLEAGTVRASAGGTFLDSFPNPNSGQDGGAGRAFAQFNDGLHFNIAGASANTTTLIGVSYTLDGLIGGSSGSADVTNKLQFGTAQLTDDFGAFLPSQPPNVSATSATGWASYSFSSNTPGLVVFNGVYALTGPRVDLGIATTLDALCGIGANCDYSHTGQFKITSLSSNVSYTSDSGVFLTGTAPTTTTPEPVSVALFGTGIAAVFVMRKKLT